MKTKLLKKIRKRFSWFVVNKEYICPLYVYDKKRKLFLYNNKTMSCGYAIDLMLELMETPLFRIFLIKKANKKARVERDTKSLLRKLTHKTTP